MHEIEYCTSCHKPFDDFRIKVHLQIETIRKTPNDTYESIPNANIDTNEIICRDCFAKFVDAFDSLNQKQDEGAE